MPSTRRARRELLAAITDEKPLLLLRETDLEGHGGMTTLMMEDELKLLDQHERASSAVSAEEVSSLQHLLEGRVEIIDFHREKCTRTS